MDFSQLKKIVKEKVIDIFDMPWCFTGPQRLNPRIPWMKPSRGYCLSTISLQVKICFSIF